MYLMHIQVDNLHKIEAHIIEGEVIFAAPN
jgi:hypothetical protein